MERHLGFLLALTVPLVASVGASREGGVGGLNITGFVWLLQLAAAVALITLEMTFHSLQRTRFPVLPWALCFGFFWWSILWSDDIGRRNVQDALQISMPLVMAVVGALFIRTEANLQRLFWAYGAAMVPLMIMAWNARGASDTGEDNSGARLVGLTAALLACVYASQWPRLWILPLIGFGGCFAATLMTGGRTALAALLMVLLWHPLIRGIGIRVVVIAAMAFAGLAAFQSKTYQERFFYKGSGSLSDLFSGRFRDAGRFDAWPAIWEEAATRPIFGHGIGTAYDFVPKVWQGMNHVHNEYLRLIFEVGLVGLFLWLIAFAYQMIDAHRCVGRTQGRAREAFAAGFMGLLLMALAALTGNPLPSNVWFTNPLFLLLGAAYGVGFSDSPASEVQPVVPSLPSASLIVE